MPTQTSLAVAQGATVRYTDHNKVVTDLAAIIAEKGAASGLASLKANSTLAQSPDAGAIATTHLAANAVTSNWHAASTSEFATSSASFADVTGVSASVTTTGGDLLVWLEGGGFGTSNSGSAAIAGINVNGVDYTVSMIQGSGTVPDYGGLSGFVLVTGLAAGTYTVKARLRTTGANTVYMNRSSLSRTTILAVELKR